MHFSIRHLTEYRYDGTVIDNLNALRVRPATTSTQRCDEFHVRIDPETRVSRHIDYFGTEVLEFGVPTAHDHLVIDVRARVVTADPAEPPVGPWNALATASYREAGGEFLLPWTDEGLDGQLDELLAALRTTTPLATLRLLCELVPDRFEYRRGATYVGSTVGDLLEAGAGGGQDFVHLGLVVLRRLGIAARAWSQRTAGGWSGVRSRQSVPCERCLANIPCGPTCMLRGPTKRSNSARSTRG